MTDLIFECVTAAIVEIVIVACMRVSMWAIIRTKIKIVQRDLQPRKPQPALPELKWVTQLMTDQRLSLMTTNWTIPATEDPLPTV